MRLPSPCVVLLVGPSGSGKTTWANDNFSPGQVIASDRLRAMVGQDEFDQRASADAFEVLDAILQKRLARKLTTVVDTLGLDDELRAGIREQADAAGLDCHVVSFDTPAALCRERNKSRSRPVPAKVLSGQIKRWGDVDTRLSGEGFAGVHRPEPVELVPGAFADAPQFTAAQDGHPRSMRFGLQIPRFTFDRGTESIGPTLAGIAAAVEGAGFDSLWVMDHFLQIPQAGREWEEMLDSYTTLGFLAGHTEKARLGVLVTGVTYRNVAHLGKIVATLDVLSGGRAICGLGAAWFEREHRAYGWEFPAVAERFTLLEDALQLLPLMWGPGSPSFEGKVVNVPTASCYPRPIQEHIPIMVGGSGEKKTLRLVAEYADACNLFGDPKTVRHKLEVLGHHCEQVGRDPTQVENTILTTVLVGTERSEVDAAIESLKPPNTSSETYAAMVNAGTISDHVGRFREFADAGIDTAIVNMPDVSALERIATFGEVISAFS